VARSRRFLELRLEVTHVAVLVAIALRLAEPDAVNYGGVIQLIGDDRVLGAENRFEEAAIGVEARRIKDCIVRFEKRAYARFKFLMDLLCAADEAHGGHAVAPLGESFRSGG